MKVSAHELVSSSLCSRPGCTEFAEHGLAECRRHADVAVLRARREAAEASNGNGHASLAEPGVLGSPERDGGSSATPGSASAALPNGSTIETVRTVSVHEKAQEVAPPPVMGKRTRANPWTREEAIAAVQAFHAEHGRVPVVTDKGFPNQVKTQKLFGSFAGMIEAAGFTRPVRGGSKPRRRLEKNSKPSKQERQTPPIVWAVKVNGTGLRYRTADEAYVAADEIEHDGERVARDARVLGQEGKADQAVDASRELAEKIRAAARAASGEKGLNDFRSSSGREPLAASPPVENGSGKPPLPEDRAPSPEPAVGAAEPGSRPDEHQVPALASGPTVETPPHAATLSAVAEDEPADPERPGWSFALTGDFARDAARVRQEAALLRQQADALDQVALGVEQLAETVA